MPSSELAATRSATPAGSSHSDLQPVADHLSNQALPAKEFNDLRTEGHVFSSLFTTIAFTGR
jgi:hypothetical protein